MAPLIVPGAVFNAAANSNILFDDNFGSIFQFLSRIVTTILLLIVTVYYLLRLYPTLLHKRKQLSLARSKVSIIGHRGSTNDGLVENTKAAFRVSKGIEYTFLPLSFIFKCIVIVNTSFLLPTIGE